MEAKELRIGNYVSNQRGDFGGLIVEPHQFTVADFAWVQLYLPIPLTEEWLVKFGGVKSILKTNTEYRIGKRLFIKRGEFFYDYGTDTKLEFVHQLQNLYYAIESQELKIK